MIFSASKTQDAANTARTASEDLANTAGQAVESTRHFTNDALDRAENKVREFSSNIDPTVNMLASKAQRLAQQSFDMASEAKERAQQQLKRAAGMTTQYVSEQPLRSVLIAAAVGAGVALLISATRNRDRY
ncbi:MAG: DUF883 family protein [Polaromonas sp.]|nr:DUF883 family protein [Polaromonas sp.]